MAKQQERILVVENDPVVSDLIAREALGSQGFETKVVTDAGSAMQQVIAFSPDVVIANLELPGLSGKDLMAALSSQSIPIPVIMIAPKGQEKDVIQAFRLGASDYIPTPVREAEVFSVVERALKTVRARRERESLQEQLKRTNAELEKRVNELTTIFSVGKAVTSVTDQKELFKQIIAAAVKITAADIGWLLLLDERTGKYLLRAEQGLPPSLQENMNQPWDDGVSSLVALSGESLAIDGEPMQRFKIASLGKAALVTPVKAGKQSIALLVMLRKAQKAFEQSDQAMLEAVSDYASISMVNAQLFRMLDQRAASLESEMKSSQGMEQAKDEIVKKVSEQLSTSLNAAQKSVTALGKGASEANLEEAQGHILHAMETARAMSLLLELTAPNKKETLILNDIANQAVGRAQSAASANKVKLKAQLSKESINVSADAEQMNMVFDALLSNAIKFSPNGGEVTLLLEKTRDNKAHVSVIDNGIGISKKDLTQVFNHFFQVDGKDGLGIGLALVRSVVIAHGGRVWAESQIAQGSSFHFDLPIA